MRHSTWRNTYERKTEQMKYRFDDQSERVYEIHRCQNGMEQYLNIGSYRAYRINSEMTDEEKERIVYEDQLMRD